MRALLHGLFGLGRCLVLVGLGAGVLAFTLAGPQCQGMDCWAWLLDTLRPHRDYAMVGAAGILMLEFLYLLTRPRRIDGEVIDFKGKGGTISVRLQTVADHLARIGDEFDDVLSLDPLLRRRKKAVDIELQLRVRDGANLPDLCRKLQDRVRQSISGHVGPFNVNEVRIRVEELVQPMEDSGGAEPGRDPAAEDAGTYRGDSP